MTVATGRIFQRYSRRSCQQVGAFEARREVANAEIGTVNS